MEASTNLSSAKFVTCSGCAHTLTWLEHSMLRVAVDCPYCGATKQFGPDVYVPEFKGYTWDEVHAQRARARPLLKSTAT